MEYRNKEKWNTEMENYDEWKTGRHGVVENAGGTSKVDDLVLGVSGSVFCSEIQSYEAFTSVKCPSGEYRNDELQPS